MQTTCDNACVFVYVHTCANVVCLCMCVCVYMVCLCMCMCMWCLRMRKCKCSRLQLDAGPWQRHNSDIQKSLASLMRMISLIRCDGDLCRTVWTVLRRADMASLWKQMMILAVGKSDPYVLLWHLHTKKYRFSTQTQSDNCRKPSGIRQSKIACPHPPPPQFFKTKWKRKSRTMKEPWEVSSHFQIPATPFNCVIYSVTHISVTYIWLLE